MGELYICRKRNGASPILKRTTLLGAEFDKQRKAHAVARSDSNALTLLRRQTGLINPMACELRAADVDIRWAMLRKGRIHANPPHGDMPNPGS